jgi:hypothetical protein
VENPEVIVPIAAFFFIFGLPIVAFVFFRVMAHRERMAMIQSGIAPAPGAKSTFGAYPTTPKPNEGTNGSPQVMLRRGIRLTAIGVALSIGLSFVGHSENVIDNVSVSSWYPGPWLLFGLVPLCIGLSQITIALISGATLRPPTGAYAEPEPTMQREGPFTTAAGPTTPTYSTYETSYTYRPDGTRELPSPTPPPEQRG